MTAFTHVNGVAVSAVNGVPLGGGPTVLLLDEFTDVNGTLPSNHTIAPINNSGNPWVREWANGGISATIQNNKVEAGGATTEYWCHDLGAGNEDYKITYDYHEPGTNADSTNRVMFRVISGDAFDNNFQLHLRTHTDATLIQLLRRVGGSNFTVDSAVRDATAPFTVTPEVTSKADGTIIAHVPAHGGAAQYDYTGTDANLATNTSVGWGNFRNGATVDNFTVEEV